MIKKKVLLRERKRHTARRVVSTPSVLAGGGVPDQVPPPGGVPGGVPEQVPPRGSRYPHQGYPGGYLTGYPPRGVRVPPRGVPGGVPDWVPPRGSGYPPGGYLTGYPPGGSGYPPRGGGPGTPPLPHGILGNVAKHYGIWVPPPVDRQIDGWTDACQNITFPRTTYAGGNKRSMSK